MRKVDLIVIHCSATKPGMKLTPEALDRMHRERGFHGCGYHFYIDRDGIIHTMRLLHGRKLASASAFIIFVKNRTTR